jgi:hypothetical protein
VHLVGYFHRTVKMASRTACYPLHARVVRTPCCDFTHKESFYVYTSYILYMTYRESRNLYNNFLNFPVSYVHILTLILFFLKHPQGINEWFRFWGFGYTVCWGCSTGAVYIAGFTSGSKLNCDNHFPHLIYEQNKLYLCMFRAALVPKSCLSLYCDFFLHSVDTTALQVGRSRVRFPMVSLEFFIYIIFPAALWPLTEINTRNISWG